MPASPEIIAFVLLLLPGLAAVSLFNVLTPATKPDTMTRVAAVVVVSVISYLALFGIAQVWTWLPDPAPALSASDGRLAATLTTDTLKAVVGATTVAILLAIIAAKCHQHDVAWAVFSTLRLSTRQGMSSHWDRVMHSPLCESTGRWWL